MTAPSSSEARTIGLSAAVLVGVGAIVGRGILALAGSAFALTGPSAILAFLINGLIALLAALSFAEMATAFPESGGTYLFARRVLSVRAAFVVGWVLWFAYIAAGLLYALGFGAFVLAALRALWVSAPGPLVTPAAATVYALLAIGGATALYTRRPRIGGTFSTYGKLAVFVPLIAVGLALMPMRAYQGTLGSLTPFFSGGITGFAAAMGLTFVVLQGFETIPAMAGRIVEPTKTIPKAMLISLGVALLVYLPLMTVVATVGAPPGTSVQAMAQYDPETVVARAALAYMGRVGFWLVLLAGLLSMLSALASSMVSAARVASSMAADRTLPALLAERGPSGAPKAAVFASGLAMSVLLGIVRDVPSAGAAASLIFLFSFLLAHITALLARKRGGGGSADAYRTPFFPLVPVLGIATCTALAAFQLGTQPEGAAVTGAWIGLGVLLYGSVFSGRAATFDALAESADPELARLRGRSPLVLAPVANPDSAPSLVALARAIAPPVVGRVLLLSILRRGAEPEVEVKRAGALIERALGAALIPTRGGARAPETLVTVAQDPWEEIHRVASARHCASVVLGLSNLDTGGAEKLESMLGVLEMDVMILRAPREFDLVEAKRVLVPVAGRGRHDELRARVLGSLLRTGERSVTFLRVLPADATDLDVDTARRRTRRFVQDEAGQGDVRVMCSDDPVAALVEAAEDADILILGLSRERSGRRVLGGFAPEVARATATATLLVGKGAR